MSCNSRTDHGELIRKPTTTIRQDGKIVAVAYNPGLMTAERATDLVMGGMALFCVPGYYMLGQLVVAILSGFLAAYCIFDGLRRPVEQPVPRAETYENEDGRTMRYNPGMLTVGRATALVLSGFAAVEALCLLAVGHPLIALVIVSVAAMMFRDGIRPPEGKTRKLNPAVNREQIEQRSE